jgi:hypothetical protein
MCDGVLTTTSVMHINGATTLHVCGACTSSLPRGTLHLTTRASAEYFEKLAELGKVVVGAGGRPVSQQLQELQDQLDPSVAKFCHDTEEQLRKVGPAAAVQLFQEKLKGQVGQAKASACAAEPVAEQDAGGAESAAGSSQPAKGKLEGTQGRADEVFSRIHVRCVEVRQRKQQVSGSWVQAVCTSRCLEAAAAESPQAEELRRTMMPCLKSTAPKSALLVVEVLTLVFLAEDDEGLLVLGFAEVDLVLPHAEVPGLCGAGTHTVLHYYETTGIAPVMDGRCVEGHLRRAFSEGVLVSLAGVLRELGAVTMWINPSPPAVSESLQNHTSL